MRSPNFSLFLALSLGLLAREVQAQVGPPTALPQGPYTSTATNGGNVINDLGQIVGYGVPVPGPDPVPLIWATPTSLPTPLQVGPHFGDQFTARGINNGGEIIGEFGSGFGQIPIYWSSPSSLPTVLSFVGFSGVSAIGINSLSRIVGCPANESAALYWSSPAADPSALPNGTFFPPICASGINDAGLIVGYGALSPGGIRVPILWPSWTTAPIALLTGGLPLPMYASGINNAGKIVGTNNYASALFWQSSTSTPSALPVGSFAPAIGAMGINTAGQIAGFGLSVGGQVALLWSPPTVSSLKASVTAFVTGGQLSPSQGAVLNQILDLVQIRLNNGQGGGAASLLRSFNAYVNRYPLSFANKAILLGQSNTLITIALALPPG